MFSAPVVQQVSQRIAAVRRATGEELLVVTVPSVAGAWAPDVISHDAQRVALQQGADSVIYVDRGDHRDAVVAQPHAWFPRQSVGAIRTTMEREFRAHEYDAGLIGAADAILAVYRAHAPLVRSVMNPAPRFGLYGWLIVAALAYLVIRGSLREGARSPGDNS